MLQALRTTIARLLPRQKNSMSLPNDFLRYGNREPMTPNWSEVVITDADQYTGYGFGIIRNRANAVARIADTNVTTVSDLDGFEHPYLSLIENSQYFSDWKFWSDISTYLDLEGVYYLMIVRGKALGTYGEAKYLKLLNPYEITRVRREGSLEVGGYIENHDGFTREIPPHMIIEIRDLNPFDQSKPYSMTDAAKESQFTLKSAGDFTRNALRNNVNSPGIISTDIVLSPDKFANFKSRILGHTRGEPILANGAGAVRYEGMQQELSKAALKDVNEINRESLFATGGVSKTIMGLEVSGVTRETSKAQKDIYIENQIIPRIRIIVDALNLDYRNTYPEAYGRDQANIFVNNPTATDQDAEIKDTQVKKERLELYQMLLEKGYDAQKSALYVNGELPLEDLGEPKEKKKEDAKGDRDTPPPETKTESKPPTVTKIHTHEHSTEHRHTINQITLEPDSIIDGQENMLTNAIVNVDEQMVVFAMNRITRKVKNAFDTEGEVITLTEKKRIINELEAVLVSFYGIIFTMQGERTAQQRTEAYEMPASFFLNKSSRDFIKENAAKAAESHVNTISNDLFKSVREAALKGMSQQEMINMIKKEYNETISKTRAQVIATTETNRAFTRAQFEADRQFIQENKLEGRAFKQLVTRSDNPCGYCLALASEPPIPFDLAFRDLDTSITGNIDGTERTMEVRYESIEAGNVHPRCQCTYDLIIRAEE